MALTSLAPHVEVIAGSVPDGKVVDFLTGKFVEDTPEEYVRQNIEKALVRQYKYAAADCEPEFRIKVGSKTCRADIVIFPPGATHLQDNAYVLVETKRTGSSPNAKKDGIAQLKSYMAACVNAEYGLWTNGDDRFCFAKRIQSGKIRFEELADIPRLGESEEEAQQPKRKDLMPATGHNLLFAFRRCHNYIAGTQGLQKPEAFWELLKLIFCKIEDERSPSLQFYATPTERTNNTVAISAKARIQKLFNDRVVSKYPSIFRQSDRTLDLNPAVVAFVVSQLQRFSLLSSPVDVKGVAYEEIVGSNLRGDRGEFFTPRNACRMAVEMLDPTSDQRMVDPSCGTGGFLITAMNHVLEKIETVERQKWRNPQAGTREEHQELYRAREEYLRNHVTGLDLNPGLVRAAKMNMVMNNDGSGGLFQANSLANPHTWSADASKDVKLGTFDVVFTNPPFGANINIDDEHILEQYELGAFWDKGSDNRWKMRLDRSGRPVLQSSQPPEVLFIERCLQMLKPKTGRMAIVLPNGILNNPALEYVRYWLMTRAQLIAVVDMARDLFQPKNDTQTSMLLLRRLDTDEQELAEAGKLDYPVFMAIAERIGHNKRGRPVYKRTKTGEELLVIKTETIAEIDPETGLEKSRLVEVRERVVDDELPEVARSFRRWLKEAAQ